VSARGFAFISGTTLVAAAALASIAAFASCKHGEYDGSYEGGSEGGASLEGTRVTKIVEPGNTGVIATEDGAFDVTILAGTFAAPTTITIVSAGERNVTSDLIVPIYRVTADNPARRNFQVNFHGRRNNQNDPRALLAAIESGGVFTPLPIAGSPGNRDGVGSYWGISQSFGTFSLELSTGNAAVFAELESSTCMGRCCAQKGAVVGGFGGSCVCASNPDPGCFIENCPDLAAAAARCSAIAATSTVGDISCNSGGGCSRNGAPAPAGSPTCCVTSGVASCQDSPATCRGFAARCNGASGCPGGTRCCVFESESYCAKDCPPSQTACGNSGDCQDLGVDGGACEGNPRCPIRVCGTLPVLCR
jgi:hypothetical protein